MKILIADKFPEFGLKTLKEDGLEVVCNPDLKERALIQAALEDQPDILIVRSTKVTREILESSSNLALVIRAGAGVNTIDLKSASEFGIYVANCPGKNSVAVAELAMGLILSVDRRIAENTAALRAGKWNKKEFGKCRGLKGRSLGIIGMGNIGRELAVRAQGFELEVLAWSRSLNDQEAEKLGVRRLNSPLEVASKSDIISVHVALTEETRGLCGKEFFNAMKDGAYFINTSRAEVVDEKALIAAMKRKGIKAGLDLFQDEPATGIADWSSKLSQHEAVTGTHHIGASTEQAQIAICSEVLTMVRAFARKGEVLHCVNLNTSPKAACILTARHLNQVGVLAALLDQLQKANINVLQMENSLFAGDRAAIAKIELNKVPDTELLESIEAENQAIISVKVVQT